MFRLILGLIGLTGIVLAFPLLFSGGSLVAIDQFMTDAEGFLSTKTLEIEVDGFALVAGPAEIEDFPNMNTGPFGVEEIATLRVRAHSLEPDTSLFLGFATAEAVDAYLSSVPHAIVEEVDKDGLVLTYHSATTEMSVAAPLEQPFWIQTTTGMDPLTLEWAIEEGDFSFVVMNEDASDGMALTADVGVRAPILGPLGIGLLLGGGVVLSLGTLLLALAL